MDIQAFIKSGDAVALQTGLQSGAVKATDVTRACLDLIEAREPDIKAWKFLDPEAAMAQAQRLDAQFADAGPSGALHGLPVGIKDVIDTSDMPTGNGTLAHEGRQPKNDAACVGNLRQAGAVILGKTESTELAFMHPSPSRNPHNIGHTPGGSSAGSAAAVGAGTLPLALGTQTGGSVIRPAAFCGCVGFKPSRDLIPRSGVAMQSNTLDTVGVITRNIASARLLSEGASGVSLTATKVKEPRLLFVHPPGWQDADTEMKNAVTEYAASLGSLCDFGALPEGFGEVPEARNRVNFYEMARFYAPILEASPELLSDVIKEAMAEGRAVSDAQYKADLEARDALIAALSALLEQYDAILTPPTLGTAPKGLSSTGNSILNGIWTHTSAPTASLPLFKGDNGLPLSVQISGAPGKDAALLDVASFLENRGDYSVSTFA